eukprot:TRINITY_DN36533_c0_g1_i1.p2 TRINITY_DN36533_c0_g1~~TRINITY_DN36533_c0_g1_i1.p2  ORF type:complete len:139 (+),score=11.26 TRINITY_DN36533_c0_g1_i1:23-418(+)
MTLLVLLGTALVVSCAARTHQSQGVPSPTPSPTGQPLRIRRLNRYVTPTPTPTLSQSPSPSPSETCPRGKVQLCHVGDPNNPRDETQTLCIRQNLGAVRRHLFHHKMDHQGPCTREDYIASSPKPGPKKVK